MGKKKERKPKATACRSCGKKCECGDERYYNLDWNGRKQFIGVVRDADGSLCKLEDPNDDNSHRIPITEAECDDIAWKATLANLDLRDEFPDVTKLFWDVAGDPAANQRIRLHPEEVGGTRSGRDANGVLSATIRVGDKVKVALNQAAITCMMYAAFDVNEFPEPVRIQCAEMSQNFASERFWAHVLKVEGDADDTQRLTLLTPCQLQKMPAPLASEPLVVERKCVFGHIPIRREA